MEIIVLTNQKISLYVQNVVVTDSLSAMSYI